MMLIKSHFLNDFIFYESFHMAVLIDCISATNLQCLARKSETEGRNQTVRADMSCEKTCNDLRPTT